MRVTDKDSNKIAARNTGHHPHLPRSSAAIHSQLQALKKAGRIRLDDAEINALAYALEGVEADGISLFGSRVERARRGGDIDLLLLTDAPAFETSQKIAVRFFSRCEEKIDVVVMNPDKLTPEQSAFLSGITREEIAP